MENTLSSFILIYVALILLILVSNWNIFKKAGKPGWASIIPIYNIFIFLEITGKPAWWFILMLIPVVNIVFAIIVTHKLSLAFGKDAGFTFGLIILPIVFLPILAFGNAVYTKPVQIV
ncbi:signal peptidase I [Candidatus Nomurabacteria bacterium RIFCSPHIGHO2_02_FULL_38_15]|uniref:Signal peptidase I n=1 Tax=Candidatus Nomurabacteria bacterium RIFCSPHIGHO2_02_FULL_38_15 TaxID=1801752 RepID=A0A1F6VSL8_9BACT|nr:MAG: signal peptidase I [Candidatus Nomurabacteria bacterium RIFCSPHIGHO2_02_FULL_38_15]